jgi:hypothetical protein
MAKHKYIETPQKMWQLFTAYKEHTKSNPVRKQVFVGKDGHVEYEERECPLTIEGFECYCMDNTNITYPDLTEYFDGKNPSYKAYFHVCSRIKRKIRQDQIKGGMVGIYNPSITQRLNNLAEKTDSRFVDGEGNDRSFKITLNIT